MLTSTKNVIRLGILLICANIFGFAVLHHQLTQETSSMLITSEETTSFVETIQDKIVTLVTE